MGELCHDNHASITRDQNILALQDKLLEWFDREARVLPWRIGEEGKRDPYQVWISEVLLQQTQVSRGLLYYERFLKAFPTVHDLAQASQEEVLKAWEGCGYYARARNLHRAAQWVADHGFPQSYEEWLTLPGVGRYTASAIASLSYHEPKAVNDGNVRRVLARWEAKKEPSTKWVEQKAAFFLHPTRPAAWNEAMMDLGATICTPKPTCQRCPVASYCLAFSTENPAQFPAPKTRAAVKEVSAVALWIGNHKHAFLEQRTGSLLGGLFGIPIQEITDTAQVALDLLCQRLEAHSVVYMGEVNHVMTHRHIKLMVYAAEASQPLTQVVDVPLARLDQKVLALAPRLL